MIENKHINFFYRNGERFVSVKLPIGCKPTVYMCCGTDNRPFEMIINDIRIAYEMLDESIPPSYTKEITIMTELPKLLGYRRNNGSLC